MPKAHYAKICFCFKLINKFINKFHLLLTNLIWTCRRSCFRTLQFVFHLGRQSLCAASSISLEKLQVISRSSTTYASFDVIGVISKLEKSNLSRIEFAARTAAILYTG